ncbi:MAG: hypothetical protein Aurels2KO_34540 [Aureliella sp.]
MNRPARELKVALYGSIAPASTGTVKDRVGMMHPSYLTGCQDLTPELMMITMPLLNYGFTMGN